jgi:bifunctional ADP-heptose synthase (sugar kinase/adenylyltransferase)
VAALKSSLSEGDAYDAVVLSDYGSGLITPALAAAVLQSVSTHTGGRSTPVLLDSRYALLNYRGLTTCTANESEVEHLLGVHINDDLDVLEEAGRKLLSRTGMQALLITRGSRGMALFEPKQPTLHIPFLVRTRVFQSPGR